MSGLLLIFVILFNNLVYPLGFVAQPSLAEIQVIWRGLCGGGAVLVENGGVLQLEAGCLVGCEWFNGSFHQLTQAWAKKG